MHMHMHMHMPVRMKHAHAHALIITLRGRCPTAHALASAASYPRPLTRMRHVP